MKGTVYILQSQKNGRYYIGSTNNLSRRFNEHQTGQVKATRYIRPVKIVYSKEFSTLITARREELYLKKQKSRALLEEMIQSTRRGP